MLYNILYKIIPITAHLIAHDLKESIDIPWIARFEGFMEYESIY